MTDKVCRSYKKQTNLSCGKTNSEFKKLDILAGSRVSKFDSGLNLLDLKILKVEYISNQWQDFTQIPNLC